MQRLKYATLALAALVGVSCAVFTVIERHSRVQSRLSSLQLAVEDLEGELHDAELLLEQERVHREASEEDAVVLERALNHCSEELEHCSEWYAQRSYDNEDHF